MEANTGEVVDNAPNPFAKNVERLENSRGNPDQFAETVRQTLEAVCDHVDNVVLQGNPVRRDQAEMAYQYGIGVLKSALPAAMQAPFVYDAQHEVERLDEDTDEPVFNKRFRRAFADRFKDQLAAMPGRVEVTDETLAAFVTEAASNNLKIIDKVGETLEVEFATSGELLSILVEFGSQLADYFYEERIDIEARIETMAIIARSRVELFAHDSYLLNEITDELDKEEPNFGQIERLYESASNEENQKALKTHAASIIFEKVLTAAGSGKLDTAITLIERSKDYPMKPLMRQAINGEALKFSLHLAEEENYNGASRAASQASDDKARLAVKRAVDAVLLEKSLAELDNGNDDEADKLAKLASGPASAQIKKAHELHLQR